MQTKTYLANSVPAALEVARKELGPDALLVNSRPAPPEVRVFGRLEVTFAFEAKPTPPLGGPPPPSADAALASGVSGRSELEEIRSQIAELRNAVGRGGDAPARTGAFQGLLADALVTAVGPEPLHPAALRLCSNGFDPETARSVVSRALELPGDPATAVERELSGRIPVASWSLWKTGESRTLAFVGPPGRGKTTSLVKIAVRHGLANRVPVKIYSAGCHCVGAQEQLARYASVLGVPCHAFETLDSLHLALNGETWRGLILIDTPGLSRGDDTEMSSFASFFRRRPEIERHLVLRADAGRADMAVMARRFSTLGPSRLLFTGLDEALTVGAMIEALLSTGIPAMFAGTGQAIPEAIEESSAADLARRACAVTGEQNRAAA